MWPQQIGGNSIIKIKEYSVMTRPKVYRCDQSYCVKSVTTWALHNGKVH